jgi:hypothetical protein
MMVGCRPKVEAAECRPDVFGADDVLEDRGLPGSVRTASMASSLRWISFSAACLNSWAGTDDSPNKTAESKVLSDDLDAFAGTVDAANHTTAWAATVGGD